MNSVAVGIRADGGSEIGFGHVMRTAAIAQSLRKAGCYVCYICSDDRASGIIGDLGFDLFVLNCVACDPIAEPPLLSNLVAEKELGLIFVDSFHASNEYFTAISRYCLVGTMGYKRRFSEGLDMIVSYLPSTDMRWYENEFARSATKTLLGVRYIPIRDEFSLKQSDCSDEDIERLFISTGGSDELNVVGGILDRLEIDEFWDEVERHVVVGEAFQHKEELMHRYSDNPKVNFHQKVSHMGDLMRHCDLAITASGYTVFELAVCGIPMVAFALSDDQAENGKVEGIMDWAGDIRDFSTGAYDNVSLDNVVSSVKAIAKDDRQRSRMRKKAISLGIDGKGSDRIAAGIIELIEDRGMFRENC